MIETIRTKLPEAIASRGVLQWGHWHHYLAIVDLEGLDPSTLERTFFVRFACNERRERIVLSARGLETLVGQTVHVHNGSLPYEKSTFSAYDGTANRLTGSFLPPVRYKVPIALKDATDAEHRVLASHLRGEGLIDLEAFSLSHFWNERAFRKALSQGYDALQASPDWELANAVDRLASRLRVALAPAREHFSGERVLGSAEGSLTESEAWEKVRASGAFATTQKGRVKWVVRPNK